MLGLSACPEEKSNEVEEAKEEAQPARAPLMGTLKEHIERLQREQDKKQEEEAQEQVAEGKKEGGVFNEIANKFGDAQKEDKISEGKPQEQPSASSYVINVQELDPSKKKK